ncbi:MAG: tetratricopeptide repeat protein, partial [Cyanobacteriota/Melainabacteria group bacterium]
ELDPNLDFAPDVKSLQDVRPAGNTELARLNNFDKIIRLGRKHAGRDSTSMKVLEDAFEWYFNNANELFENERFEEAERDYRIALEKMVQLDEPRPEEEATLLENLGELYMLLDRADLAVQLYEQTEVLRVTAKIPIPKYVSALLKTGGDYEERGFVFDAEPYYRKAVEVAGNYLEVHDPLLKLANDACMRVTREKTSLVSRFSPGELDRLKQTEERDKAIMHRKPKIAKKEETKAPSKDIWITQEELVKIPKPASTSNLKWWLLSIIPIAILSFITVFHFPSINGTVDATSKGRSVYSSLDGRKKVVLTSDGLLTYVLDGNSTVGSYKILGNAPQDMFALLVGHLRRQNRFIDFKKTDILGFGDTLLYPEDSPEQEMTGYVALCQTRSAI